LAFGIALLYDDIMMWLFFLVVLLVPLLAVLLDSQLGRALARRVEGSVGDGARLTALESEVERLSRELETLQDQTEFVNRLLEERARGRLSGGEGD
jgi:cell division protein FtsB